MTLSFSISHMLSRQDHSMVPIEGIRLTHPSFNNTVWPAQGTTWSFTNQPVEERLILEDGSKVAFIPAGFEVGLPERSTNAEMASDMAIQFSTIDTQMINELERAANRPTDPIIFEYRLYRSDQDPPGFYLNLHITEVDLSDGMLSANAGREDLLNMPFPNRFYDVQQFPGLDR